MESSVTMYTTRNFLRLFILFSFVALQDGQKYRCDYTYVPEVGGYLKLHMIPANWHEAQLRCRLEGAVLASPITSNLSYYLPIMAKNISSSRGAIFTGIHATFSRGDFHSVEGVPLSNINFKWSENEPDNIENSENCLIMLLNGKLADKSCDDTFPYICYKKLSRAMHISSCGTSDPEYNFDDRTGNCYKFHKVPRTWSRAFMTCTAEGGYLVILNSEKEAKVVREIFAENPASSMIGNFEKDIASIGFQDWDEHGTWRTIHGQTLREAGYDQFRRGEPNSNLKDPTIGEFCGSVTRSGQLNDIRCGSRFPFICEKDPNSLICD